MLAGFRVIRSDITADSILGASIADHDLVASDQRRSGDRIGFRRISSLHVPHRSSRALIQRHKSPVERSYVNFAIVKRYAAIHDIAAKEVGSRSVNVRIVRPFQFSGFGIESEDDAPGAGCIDDAVRNNWCRFQAARGSEFLAPYQSESGDCLFVDLVEGAEALVRMRAAVEAPILLSETRGRHHKDSAKRE